MNLKYISVSMANCYFAEPLGMKHCYIPFFMLLISNALLVLARHSSKTLRLRHPATLSRPFRRMLAHCASQTCLTQLLRSCGISCSGRITSYGARAGKTWPIPNMQNWDGGGLIPVATRSGRNSLRSLNQV